MKTKKLSALRGREREKLTLLDSTPFDADLDSAELELCDYGVTVRPKERGEIADGGAESAVDDWLDLPEGCK